MSWVIVLAAVVVLVLAGVAIHVRTVEMRPGAWHVRPAEAAVPQTPNYALYAGEGAVMVEGETAAIARAIDEAAMEAGWTSIAGDPAQGFVTYVARSRIMGFPDAISVVVEPAGGGIARVEIFARARFGQSDMGVNEGHARYLLAATEAAG